MNSKNDPWPEPTDDSAETARERPLATPAGKRGVAKVSHTLSIDLAERLESFAFFQRISESAVIEHSLLRFFKTDDDDTALGNLLRSEGAGRRRRLDR